MTDRTTDLTTARRRARRTAPHDYEPPACCAQSLAIVRRNLIHIKRMPEMLMDVTIQPVMFVLLFAFVFGGSIAVRPRGRLPRVADGRDHGPDDRLRRRSSWPSASPPTSTRASSTGCGRCRSTRPSVLVGRSISSLIHSSIGIVVMSLTGLVDRLADPQRLRQGAARLRAAAAVGLRDDLGRHPGRLVDALGRGGQRR